MANRKYTEDQRSEAIRLVSAEGHSAASVGREFSVSVGTVHRWVSDAMALRRTSPVNLDATEADVAAHEQQDLESQLRGVIRRIGQLETQFEQLVQRRSTQEN